MLLLPVRPAGVCDAASAVGAVGGTKSCVCGSVWRCVKAIWPHLLLGRAFVLPMRCCDIFPVPGHFWCRSRSSFCCLSVFHPSVSLTGD